MLLVYVAVVTSTVLPTGGNLPPCPACDRRPDHVDDLVLRLAVGVHPALDDLDAIEIGAVRVLRAQTVKRRRLRQLSVPPIGTPLR